MPILKHKEKKPKPKLDWKSLKKCPRCNEKVDKVFFKEIDLSPLTLAQYRYPPEHRGRYFSYYCGMKWCSSCYDKEIHIRAEILENETYDENYLKEYTAKYKC
jgi:hypothetical protein